MPRGFLLHSRPYRETSSLLSFFSESDGRLDTVARASRASGKKRHLSPVLFSAYDLAWSGKGDLKQLNQCDAVAPLFQLQGKSLYCGLYVNELLYRLLPRQEPEPVLFQAYIATLQQLAGAVDVEPCLRLFELTLLQAIGYGLLLHQDVEGCAIDPDAFYRYLPEHGLQLVTGNPSGDSPSGFGRCFLAIEAGDYREADVRRLAKQLLRAAMALYLGSRPLQSRELFR